MKSDPSSCEICRAPAVETRELNGGYSGYFCKDCDLLTTETRRGAEDAAEAGGTTYDLEHRILTYYLRHKEFRSNYDRILKAIGRQVEGKVRSLLDVGSNIGFFANHVRKRGIAVETIEIREALRAFQRSAYGIEAHADIDALDEGRRYDVIVMMDVLEHIRHPVTFLRKTRGHLAKGGVLFVQLPNKNSLSAKIAGKGWNWWSAPDHLYHMSGKSLRLMAHESGFEISRLWHVSPVLDDLVNLPCIGRLFRPVGTLNRWINVNPAVPFRYGSLIRAFLKRAT